MPCRNRISSIHLCVIAVSVLPIQLAAAGEPAQVDPKADAVLRKLADHLQNLRSFSVEMRMSLKAEGAGIKHSYKTKHQLSVKKPDKLALINAGGIVGRTVIHNGKTVYMKDPISGKSGTTTPPGDGGLDDVSLTYIAPAMSHEWIAKALIEALVSSDPYEELSPGSGGLEYLGTQKIDGVECHELKWTFWTMFVDTGDKPLIRRVKPDTSDTTKETPKIKMDLSIAFKDWKLDIEIPDKRWRR